MSIQSNFPIIKPSLMLDFAGTKSLDPRITYSRSTTGTYYDGSTTTLAEQNLLLYSEQFDNAVWAKGANVTVSANSTTAPDGTITADTISTSSGADTSLNRISQINGTGTGAVTASIYLRSDAPQTVRLKLYDSNGGSLIATNDVSVTSAWTRFTIAGTVSAASSGISIGPAGTTALTNIYIWGAQLEQRTQATAYTATTSSAITNYVPTLQTAAINQPRFDHDPITGESLGLLAEGSSTNLLSASSQFDSPVWTKSYATVNANAISAPDGTLTASKLVESTATGYHYFLAQAYILASTTYTFTVFLKAAEKTRVRILLGNYFSPNPQASFNLQNGTIVSSSNTTSPPTIQNIGNGWYRCSITGVSIASSGSGMAYIYTMTDAGVVNYTGDGVSGVYAWGAQLEQNSFASSYIPTPLTFTSRASTATYRADDGIIRTAATNVARYERNLSGGSNILLESAATNLSVSTDRIDDSTNWILSGANTAINSKYSPDGSMMADKLIEDSSLASSHRVSYFLSGMTISSTYTLSIFLAPSERTYFRIFLQSGAYVDCMVNTVAGTVYSAAGSNLVSASISSQQYSGGFYRVSLTFTAWAASFYAHICLCNGSSSANYTYDGDGKSGAYIWGIQLEAGSTATSYIPSVDTWTGRASTATYYNASGVLSTASSGVARTTYNPSNLNAPPKLLLEPAATNLLLYSEQFDNASSWNSAGYATTVTTNAYVAPDGNTTADKLIANTSNSNHIIVTSTTLTAGIQYTLSMYIKAAGLTKCRLMQSSDGFGCDIDLLYSSITNISGATSTITGVGNEWYRITTTWTQASTGSKSAALYLKDASGNLTFAGDNTSGMYIWGAQLETGYAATSYIPTTSATVTRAADTSTSAAGSRSADVYTSAQVTRSADATQLSNINFNSWFRNLQGSFYCEYSTMFSVAPMSTFILSAGLLSRWMYIPQGGNQLQSYDGITQLAATGVGTGTGIKGAMNYSTATGSAILINGTAAVSGTFNSSTTRNAQYLSVLEGGSFGRIKKIAYYPYQLTNAQLQSLTS